MHWESKERESGLRVMWELMYKLVRFSYARKYIDGLDAFYTLLHSLELTR